MGNSLYQLLEHKWTPITKDDNKIKIGTLITKSDLSNVLINDFSTIYEIVDINIVFEKEYKLKVVNQINGFISLGISVSSSLVSLDLKNMIAENCWWYYDEAKETIGGLEMIHGKELSDKILKFQKLLAEINEKHIDFFKARPTLLNKLKHDNIISHCGYIMSNGLIGIMFTSFDLPENIKQDCLEAFEKSFSTT